MIHPPPRGGDGSDVPLEALADQMPGFLWAVDLDRRLTMARGAGLAAAGTRSQELVGQTLDEVLPPGHLGLAMVERVLAGEASSWETGWRGRVYSVHADALRAKGVVVGAIGVALDVTEARRAERDLRLRQRMLDTVGQAVMATDPAGRIIYWNRAAEQLYGWSAEEVLGRDVTDVTPTEQSKEQAREIMDHLRAGRPWSGEFTVRRKDGASFPALVTDAPVYGDDGELAAIIGISYDLTERKRADAAIRESEERYRTLVDRLPVGLYRSTPEGRFLTVNPAYAEMLGAPSMQAVLASDAARWYVDPDDRGRWREALEREGAVSDWDVRQRRWDGSVIWTRDNARMVRDEDGTILFYEGIVRDVTEERAAERDTQQMAAIVESSHHVIISTDLEGTIVAWNRGAEAMYGYPARKMLGRSILPLVPADELDECRENLKRVRRGEAVRVETRRRAASGELHEVVVSLSPIRSSDGEIVAISGIHQDIGDRKRAERELERTVADLRLVDQQRRLLLSRLVEAQEEERRRIAADIHDDSIQVMTAAGIRLGALERRADGQATGMIRRLQGTVGEAIARLRTLMFELYPPTLERSGIAAAIRQHLETVEADAGLAHRLDDELEREPPAEVGTIAYRIAMEALANVRKHAQASRVDLCLRGRDGGLHVSIADDGVGFSGDDEGSAPTHLGLMTMRERAKMAGGWCRLASEPGIGTTVEFWLPTSRRAAPEPQSPAGA